MKVLINGEWRDSLSGKMFVVHNPATGDVVGEAPLCGEDDVRSAVGGGGGGVRETGRPKTRGTGGRSSSSLRRRCGAGTENSGRS